MEVLLKALSRTNEMRAVGSLVKNWLLSTFFFSFPVMRVKYPYLRNHHEVGRMSPEHCSPRPREGGERELNLSATSSCYRPPPLEETSYY